MVEKKIIISLFQLMFILCSCSGQSNNRNDLIGSVWMKEGTFCADSLHFYSDGKYLEYYCEFQEHMKGNYIIMGDTLILTEYKLSSEIISNNPKAIPTYAWKYIFLKSNVLQKLYFEDLINGGKSIGTETTWKYLKVK